VGQTWKAHPTNGSNWDFFTIGDGNQFLIGSWGDSASSSSALYTETNNQPYTEKQYILRIHGTGSFTSIILPFRKNETSSYNVTQQSCGFQLMRGSEVTCFSNSSYSYDNPQNEMSLRATFTSDNVVFSDGFGISGGPVELLVSSQQITIYVTGSNGTRNLTLPNGPWYAVNLIPVTGDNYQIDYQLNVPLVLNATHNPISTTAAPTRSVSGSGSPTGSTSASTSSSSSSSVSTTANDRQSVALHDHSVDMIVVIALLLFAIQG